MRQRRHLHSRLTAGSATDDRRLTGRSDPPQVDASAPEAIDPAHLAAIDEGLAQLDRGDFAATEAIAALYRRADL